MNQTDNAIVSRRNQIPPAYRGIYDRATSGQSLRASVNAHCLECVGWKKQEIRHCTAVACPLYAVRPYRILQTAHKGQDLAAGTRKSGKGVL
ncbi:hypothetical protein ACQ9LF_05655 [Anaerohalosphaeraceae bacterium U12dextr]